MKRIFLFAILSFVLLVHAQGRSTMSEVRASLLQQVEFGTLK